jgi:hypothetical protein
MRDARSFVSILNILPIIALYKKPRLADNQRASSFICCWMCFPSKSQKALYSDQAQPDTKAPAPAAVTTTTTSTTPLELSMAPNVAIVIYTLYGHIATRSSLLLITMSNLLPLCSL